MKEIWKEIKGYPNYMVSNMGRVKSLGRWVNYKNKGKRWKKEKILKQQLYFGYLCVGLRNNGKLKIFRVHRLIAQAFIPNPNNYPQVNHKDENKQNNCVCINEDGSVNFEKSNLEWCDAKYNNNYGTRLERITNGKCSKPVLQYDLNGNFIKEWPSTMEVERQLGFSNSHISKCCNNKPNHNTVGGFNWEFKKEDF